VAVPPEGQTAAEAFVNATTLVLLLALVLWGGFGFRHNLAHPRRRDW
jgi:hypothetical protein